MHVFVHVHESCIYTNMHTNNGSSDKPTVDTPRVDVLVLVHVMILYRYGMDWNGTLQAHGMPLGVLVQKNRDDVTYISMCWYQEVYKYQDFTNMVRCNQYRLIHTSA